MHMDEDKLLIAGIEDKREQCEERYMITNTAFLDVRQRSVAEIHLKKCTAKNWVFRGGYPQAERCILMFLPEYVDEDEAGPLSAVRINKPQKAGDLSHRDYLGALMGLGIKRECIGDILVRSGGADIIVLEEICDYILLNFSKAGRVYLEAEKISLNEIRVPEQKFREKIDTVASLRLDNIISSAFNVPRTTAAAAIKSGLIFVGNIQTEKADLQIKEGDVIAYRGKGKCCLAEIGGKSRKDRQYIRINIYE
ncbi:MAG: RNA-binding protein [Firmicutes bacterium]|nr:RNA-binding protein [Bacillota bacterium]